MKNRFVREKKNSWLKNLLVSLAVFGAVFLIFYLAVTSFSARTQEEEMRTLEAALTRGVTSCYAVEGSYPESLAWLKERYGLVYNEEKYFVDYRPQGANLMPDITILPRSRSRK